MNPLPKIRTFSLDEWETYKGIRLRALADSPDAFGRTLAEEQERSDAEWVNRLTAGLTSGRDLPLVAEVAGEPVGLAWGRIEPSDPDAAHLYQMWVAPSHRRLGVGQMLLDAVINWAKTMKTCYLDLGVTYRDSPAMRLYTRAGFEPAGKRLPLRPGSAFVELPMRLKLRNCGS